MKKRPKPKHPGDVLRQARIYNEITVYAMQNRMGISMQQRQAIEDWKLEGLPDNAHLMPLLKKYAAALDVDFMQLQKQFPTALAQRSDSSFASQSKADLDKSVVYISRFVRLGIVLVLVGIIGGYLAWQSSSLGGRPNLNITTIDGQTVQAETFEITGTTSETAQIFVNGSTILTNPDGVFTANVILQEGPNIIMVRAVNNIGGEAEETLTIIRQTNQ